VAGTVGRPAPPDHAQAVDFIVHVLDERHLGQALVYLGVAAQIEFEIKT